MRFSRILMCIMTLVFMVFIWVPLFVNLTTPQSEISTAEKRKLAPKPKLKLESLAEFPKAYESYYNDHFGFRNTLVYWRNFLQVTCFAASTSDRVIMGKNGRAKCELSDFTRMRVFNHIYPCKRFCIPHTDIELKVPTKIMPTTLKMLTRYQLPLVSRPIHQYLPIRGQRHGIRLINFIDRFYLTPFLQIVFAEAFLTKTALIHISSVWACQKNAAAFVNFFQQLIILGTIYFKTKFFRRCLGNIGIFRDNRVQNKMFPIRRIN